jgi:hypothetical protein
MSGPCYGYNHSWPLAFPQREEPRLLVVLHVSAARSHVPGYSMGAHNWPGNLLQWHQLSSLLASPVIVVGPRSCSTPVVHHVLLLPRTTSSKYW